MKKRRVNMLQIILLIFFFIGFFVFVYRNWDEVADLEVKNTWLIIPLSLLIILFLFMNGLVNKYMLSIFDVELSFKEWFGLSAMNTMANYFIPFGGGAISNAFFLRQKRKFSYSSFISIFSAVYIVIFWVNSIVGLLSLLVVNFLYNSFSLVIFITFLAGFIVLSFVIIVSPKFPTTKNPYLNKLVEVINSWNKIRSNRRVIIITALCGLTNIIIISSMAYIEFLMLGTSVSILRLLLLVVFSTFSLFVSITPGSLGVKEAFLVYSGSVVGISGIQIVAVSILERLVMFIISFILGSYFSYSLNKD